MVLWVLQLLVLVKRLLFVLHQLALWVVQDVQFLQLVLLPVLVLELQLLALLIQALELLQLASWVVRDVLLLQVLLLVL